MVWVPSETSHDADQCDDSMELWINLNWMENKASISTDLMD